MLRQLPQVLLDLRPPLLDELVLLHHLALHDSLVRPLRDEVAPERLRDPGGERDDVAESSTDGKLGGVPVGGVGSDPSCDEVGNVGGATGNKRVRGLMYHFRVGHGDCEVIRCGAADCPGGGAVALGNPTSR